jgi:drug/metabolite transporter (DMT)-like permease
MTSHAQAANRRGILAMMASMACFVANDTLAKHVGQAMPAGQLVFLRGVFATLLLLAIAHAFGATARIAALLDRRVMVRSLFDAFATFAFITSLLHLPLGNVTAINMAIPLFITLFAVLALRERVGPSRWIAIGIGFAGVLFVVQPSGDAFNVYALICLGGTLLQAARDLITRTLDKSIPSILVALSTTAAATLLAAVWSLFTADWQPVSAPQLAQLAAAGVFLSGAFFLLAVSMRGGDMSVIAPFRYTALLFAIVLGYLVWGEVPNGLAWAGIALLVGAGVYVLHSERAHARLAPEAIRE